MTIDRNNILKQISEIGMIPVLTIDKKERALPLAKALSKGGLPLMEVMLRSEDALACIEIIAKELPDFIIGAGTVLTVDLAKKAIDAGAMFLVAPGFNPEVVRYALERNIPIVPGTVTPTEVEAARALGVHTLKFFPAVQQGGLDTMKLLSGSYPDVRWVPTGDMTRDLVKEYLPFCKVAATGGDFMLKYDDIHSDNYEKITADVEETILEYLDLRIDHFGFNSSGSVEANALAAKLGDVFHLGIDHHAHSTFAGKLFEVCHEPVAESLAHIGIGSRDALRAYHYLKRCGIEFDESSLKFKEDGRLYKAYLRERIGGFAFHLFQS